MRLVLVPVLLVVSCSLLLPPSNAFQLCTNQRAPVILNGALQFCSDYRDGNASCCDVADDAALQMQLVGMGFQQEGFDECVGVVKSILCALCSPFSAELFIIGTTPRAVPVLCSGSAGSYAQSEDPTEDYCKQIWKYCKNTPIWNSPFQSSVQENPGLTSPPSMLTDLWQSEEEFCASFSGTSDDQSVCFNGHGVSFNSRQPSPQQPSEQPSAQQPSEKPSAQQPSEQPSAQQPSEQPSPQQPSKLGAILAAISIAAACAAGIAHLSRKWCSECNRDNNNGNNIDGNNNNGNNNNANYFFCCGSMRRSRNN